MSTLVYQAGGAEIKIPIDKDSLVIGRSRSCDVCLREDTEVSRRHAEVRRLPDGQFSVHDLGSTNGTIVNGSTVSTWVLKDGDELLIGETKIKFLT